MSHISAAVLKTLPKKPLNAYFKFRGERLQYHAGDEDRVKIVKKEWDSMDEKKKDALEKEYKDALDQYKKDIEDWKAKNGISEADWKIVKEKDKEAKKTEKSKGSKVVEDKKEKKEEKSKSKDTKPERKTEASKEKGDKKGGKPKKN